MQSTMGPGATANSNEPTELAAGPMNVSEPIFQNILVAVDGGEPTSRAVQAAVKLAEPGTKVSLVHVVNPATEACPPAEPPEEPCLISAQNDFVLGRHADEIPAQLLGERFCREGDVNRQIVAVARGSRADLLVIGTHGPHALGRLLLGSTAVYVLRHLPCAALVVGHGGGDVTGPAKPSRILVGVDSDIGPGVAAAEMASRLAGRHHARLALVHVVPPGPAPDYRIAAAGDDPTPGLRELGEVFLDSLPITAPAVSDVNRCVREGDAARELLSAATEWNADLIVIGTHGRHGLRRLMLGSTAEKVACGAPCPVLCVPFRACGCSHPSNTCHSTQ